MSNGENWPGWQNVPHARDDFGANLNTQISLLTTWASNIALVAKYLGINTTSGQSTLFTWNNTAGIFGAMTQSDVKTAYPDLVMELYYGILEANQTDTEITDAELVGELDALLNYAPWYGDDQNVFLIPSAGADGTLVLGAHNEPKPADEVLIDTHLKTVTLNGQNAYPLLKDGSSFFSLAPGDNIMYLTSDVSSDTGKAEIKFKQGFISI